MAREVNSMFAVPEDEPNEKANSDNGEPQIDMPSMQHRRRCDRAQGGQDQQQGSPALGEFLLFDHSRFSSRLAEPTLLRTGVLFPGLKFSLTRGSGTRSALHDDTHAPHNARKSGSDQQLQVRARQCTLFPSPPSSVFESWPPPWRWCGQRPAALLP